MVVTITGDADGDGGLMAIKTSNSLDGYWNTDAHWTPAGKPVAGDIVTIKLGDKITVIFASQAAAQLTITGELVFRGNYDLTISGDSIVSPGGLVDYYYGTTASVWTTNRLLLPRGASYTIAHASSWVVAQQLKLQGVSLASSDAVQTPTLTLGKPGLALGGSFCGIDCSSGNRMVAYGSKNLGNNTNVDFYLARGKRAVSMLNRRAMLTGLTG